MTDQQQFARRLTLFRKAKGWTQAELAEKCGVDSQQISAWESVRYWPSLTKFVALARALGLTLDELWGATSPPET